MSETLKESFSEHDRLGAAVSMLYDALNYVERHKLGRPIHPCPINWTTSVPPYGLSWPYDIKQISAADILEEALADAVDAHIAFKRDNGSSAKSADILFGIVVKDEDIPF